MRKRILTTLIIAVSSLTIIAQDIVVLKTGEKIDVLVKKVGITSVEYVRHDNQQGPIYEVLKANVLKIMYKNGVVDIFNVSGTELPEEQLNQGTFIDGRDSASYKWVKIGDQVWMSENLRYDVGQSYCPESDNNCNECGRYYLFDDAIVACPQGWHLPTDDDWKELEIEVGMSEVEAGKRGWRGTPPGQAPTLLRGGHAGLNLSMCGTASRTNFSRKNPIYVVNKLNEHAFYWTSTNDIYSDLYAFIRHFKGRASIERTENLKTYYFPIRCIKNTNQ